jgi:hypothetical protein
MNKTWTYKFIIIWEDEYYTKVVRQEGKFGEIAGLGHVDAIFSIIKLKNNFFLT